MAQHIHGPLYYERMGRTGPVIAFIHPNPMDQSCWIFQMAHLSTWYRCIAIDIPGYGRSPKADAGLTMDDMAQACWEAIDDALPGEKAILAGCSVGSSLAPYMYHQRPDKTAALVLSGTGYNPNKEFTKGRIDNYTRQWHRLSLGLHFRRSKRGVSHDPDGAFFREPVHRTQRTRRRADDHPPVQSARAALSRRPSRAHRLPDDHPHRQRRRQPSARLRAPETAYRIAS